MSCSISIALFQLRWKSTTYLSLCMPASIGVNNAQVIESEPIVIYAFLRLAFVSIVREGF
jgi:hypothetical protein